MDNSGNRLEAKLDKMIDKMASIDNTLSRQSAILDEHVRRSTNLEAQMLPIQKHVAMVQGGFKLFGLLALIVGIVEGAIKLVGG